MPSQITTRSTPFVVHRTSLFPTNTNSTRRPSIRARSRIIHTFLILRAFSAIGPTWRIYWWTNDRGSRPRSLTCKPASTVRAIDFTPHVATPGIDDPRAVFEGCWIALHAGACDAIALVEVVSRAGRGWAVSFWSVGREENVVAGIGRKLAQSFIGTGEDAVGAVAGVEVCGSRREKAKERVRENDK